MGCSGSFRFERAVKCRHRSVRLHSNDVFLLSCALGALATGATFDLVFKGRLRFVKRKVRRGSFEARAADWPICSPIRPMPVPGSPEPSARPAASPSRSSNAARTRQASSSCPDDGSSPRQWKVWDFQHSS